MPEVSNTQITSTSSELLEKLLKFKQGKKVDASGILVMDDCLADKGKWAKDPDVMDILMNGRHSKLTYILTMQAPLGLLPDLRFNFDYVFLSLFRLDASFRPYFGRRGCGTVEWFFSNR